MRGDTLRRQASQTVKLRMDAIRAVRSRSHGQDQATIREDLRREFGLRNVATSEEQLGRLSSQIAASYGLAGTPRVLHGWLSSLGQVHRVLKEAEGPEWLRPPKGEYPKTGHWCSVRLQDIESRQAVLDAIATTLAEDGNGDEVVACAWLCLARDSAGIPVIAVCAGQETLGYVPQELQESVSSLVKQSKQRGKAVWIDAFIERKHDQYIVDISLPDMKLDSGKG